jgi:hypothetical protein
MDEFYDVIQQEDRVFDPYDYSLHFVPLSIDAKAQRIERNIFYSAHSGHCVVTVSVSLPPVGTYHVQYFLDPTEQDLTNILTIIADKFTCHLDELQIQDLSRPFNNDGLTDRLLHPSVWSDICQSISPRPLTINLQRSDSFWRFSLGYMVVEHVGSLTNPTAAHVLLRHYWLQYQSLTEMIVFPEHHADLRDRTVFVTVDTNIQNAAVSYNSIECSSTTAIAMLQQWLCTQLSEIYPANIFAPQEQLHFFEHFPLSDTVQVQQWAGDVTAVILRCSWYSTFVNSHRLWGISHTIQLIQILPPQSNPNVRDWQEQLHIPLNATRPPQRTIASLSVINFDQSWLEISAIGYAYCSVDCQIPDTRCW